MFVELFFKVTCAYLFVPSTVNVPAFKATLVETREADLQLHIIDVADERRQENIDQVNDVLHEIGADEVPQLLIYNKIDLVEELVPRIVRDDEGKPVQVWLSAHTGVGCELLLQAISECLAEKMLKCRLRVPARFGSLRGALYKLNCIHAEQYDDLGNCLLNIRLPMADWNRLKKDNGTEIEKFIITD